MKDNHLTSEEMERLLWDAEEGDAKQGKTSQHLRNCRACSAEVESLRLRVGDLRAAAVRLAAMGASERQRQFTLLPEPSRRTPRAMWAVLAAAALICTAGPIAVRHHPVAERIASAPKQQMQGDVSDEQLLSNVQDDLASAVPASMLPLEASVSSADATGSTYNASDNATSIAKENE